MTKQYGFYFDAERCVQCFACELACKSTRNLEPGVSWRKVIEIWKGDFPEVSRTFVSLSCLHCARPSCLEVCPTEAIYKRAEDGIVIVDKDKCISCILCVTACSFAAIEMENGYPVFLDECRLCGECVEACPEDAIAIKEAEKEADVSEYTGVLVY